MELIKGGCNLRVIKVTGWDEAYFYDRIWRRWGTGEIASPKLQIKLTKFHIQQAPLVAEPTLW